MVTRGLSAARHFSCPRAFSMEMTSGTFPGYLAKAMGSSSFTEYNVSNLIAFRPSCSLSKPRLASSWFVEYKDIVVES